MYQVWGIQKYAVINCSKISLSYCKVYSKEKKLVNKILNILRNMVKQNCQPCSEMLLYYSMNGLKKIYIAILYAFSYHKPVYRFLKHMSACKGLHKSWIRLFHQTSLFLDVATGEDFFSSFLLLLSPLLGPCAK